MNWYLIVYIVGAVIFYIGSAAMYLECEWRVTLLTLLTVLFLFAPFVALIWPLALLGVSLEMADSTTPLAANQTVTPMRSGQTISI